ncbi:lipid A biosynthesis lauroyl acyltransferase [Neisseria sp. Ec49-e6-T10]|uniref:lipid A biosynthesis lauroyl acyltransferase n=1 Tax=Neisseria sp. Ec49-e6-T10 TaxID=3140744 RepID=UPI003EBC911F
MKIALFVLYLLHFLPITMLHLIARCVGWSAFYLFRSRRRVGEINLKLCFPQWSDNKRKKILQANFYHMAALYIEYSICWYGSAKRISNLVSYENKHYLDEMLAEKKNIILLYPHFTAFEVCGNKMNQDVPFVSMYSHQKNQVIDQAIYKYRHRYNSVYLVSRQEGFRNLIKVMKNHPEAPLMYLPDQDFGEKDSIFVQFFGVTTATTPGLNKLARLTNATIIPLIATRQKNKFVLTFHPPWQNFPTNDEYQDTQRMNDFIESQVLQQPEQYFWLHKRFKTRPKGEEKIY